MASKYEFTIQKTILKNGQVSLAPVVRVVNSGIINKLFKNNWERISMVYDKYIVMDLPFEPDLTIEQCNEHIEGYKKVLEEKHGAEKAKIEYIDLTSMAL